MKHAMKHAILALAVLALTSFAWAQSNNSGIDKELNHATQIIQEMTGPNATAGKGGRDANFTQILDGNVRTPSQAQVHEFMNAIEHAEQSAMAR